MLSGAVKLNDTVELNGAVMLMDTTHHDSLQQSVGIINFRARALPVHIPLASSSSAFPSTKMSANDAAAATAAHSAAIQIKEIPCDTAGERAVRKKDTKEWTARFNQTNNRPPTSLETVLHINGKWLEYKAYDKKTDNVQLRIYEAAFDRV